MPIPYTTKAGTTQYCASLEEFEEMNENYEGMCLACGATQGQCEPDARMYQCSSCGMLKVYGAEEMLIMGLVKS